ncbi:MAG: ACT domain-containing protein [Rhodobacteraceae bacterium]|nr:ACT domain-containing protein [Paracoccaceae bacterium]
MTSRIVLTVIAQDRAGLVDRLAMSIAEVGGNWVESSMARLGGEFAGIVSVDVDTAAVEGLETLFKSLQKDGIEVSLRAGKKREERPVGSVATLELLSQDHPGILRKVTRILNEYAVSIDSLETEVTPGSMSGEPMFRAVAKLHIPPGLTTQTLGDALQATAADMMADIKLGE